MKDATNIKPHIVLVVPRGEAVRNFLYSDTLRELHEHARVTLLSVIDDERFLARFRPMTDEIVPLKRLQERRTVTLFRHWLHEAHFRWLWSEVAQNVWELREEKAQTLAAKMKWALTKASVRAIAYRPILERLTEIERALSWYLRPNDDLVSLFRRLQPDLVFNCSHIHGPAGELPVKIAHSLGIPTVGFIFSWDNLTSRSRIFVPYDYYFVWHEGMKSQLLSIYPNIPPDRVFVTGTPQFDYHFKSEFQLSREELARRIGIDPTRPFVFYTAGIAKHFPDEHRHVEFVARTLQEMDINPKPQLVVRTYVKGTSPEMRALAHQGLPDVVFPEVQWDETTFMPMYEDLATYTGCLRHAQMGVNAASTVSLELMMFDKPVMNIGFDPPGSDISHAYRWVRHLEFDHYKPIIESGATMVAKSSEDMRAMLMRGLTSPEIGCEKRKRLLQSTFGMTLDGLAGRRIAEHLVRLADKVRV